MVFARTITACESSVAGAHTTLIGTYHVNVELETYGDSQDIMIADARRLALLSRGGKIRLKVKFCSKWDFFGSWGFVCW
jgi:hypothetical protein